MKLGVSYPCDVLEVKKIKCRINYVSNHKKHMFYSAVITGSLEAYTANVIKKKVM